MQSRLTLNVNVQYVKDWGATLRFLRALNPITVIAVIDTLSAKPRVLELKAALPNTKIIVRCIIVVHDGGVQKELDGSMHLAPQGAGDTNEWLVSPENFLGTYGELGQGGLSLSYFNEPMIAKAQPADITRQVRHMLKTIDLAAQKNISLVVGNWGIGHELTEDFDDVIDMVGKHSDLHMLGVHAYAPMDLTKCLTAIIARCNARPLAKPRIGITEFGWDTTGPGDKLNGYKSQPSVNTGYKFANWEIDTFENTYLPYVEGGWLEFIATFGWGYAASFPNDDVETDTDWQTAILNAATNGDLSVTTTQPTTPPHPVTVITPPPYKGIGKSITLGGSSSWNLRSEGEINGQVIGSVKIGEVITIYTSTIQPNGGHSWYYIERAHAPEGESISGWIAYVLPATGTLPPVDPPPVVNPTPPAETMFSYTMTFNLRSKEIEAARLTAIENGVKAILSGMVWLGAGIGDSEIEVKVNKAA